MSNATLEAVTVETTVTTKKPSKKPTSKKPVAKKTTKKVKKITPRPARDDARSVAFASNGKLNTDQVRILRFLKSCKKPVGRIAIKVGVGIGAETLYSQKWLDALWNLHNRKLIKIEDSTKYTDKVRAQHFHSITEKGKELLAEMEKTAKEVARSK